MIRRTTALTVALTTSLAVVAPPAEAARPDPAKALERRLAGPGGVRVTSVYRSIWGARKRHGAPSRSKELYQFGGGKVVALDISYPNSLGGLGPSRTIGFPDRAYGWTRKRPDYLPEGKSWILYPGKNDLYLSCGKIRLSNLAVVRHVLSTTKTRRAAGSGTTLYEGSVTVGELYKLDRGVWVNDLNKPTGAYASYAKLPVKWRLWIGRDQLVRRCRTTYDEPESPWDTKQRRYETADVRFSGWSRGIRVDPPPADQVATRDELIFPEDDEEGP